MTEAMVNAILATNSALKATIPMSFRAIAPIIAAFNCINMRSDVSFLLSSLPLAGSMQQKEKYVLNISYMYNWMFLGNGSSLYFLSSEWKV